MVWGKFQFSGTLTAVATPFTQNGEAIDYESMDSLLAFQAKAGIQGVVVCGSTGEAASLSDAEYQEVVRFVSDRCSGKMQVVAGIGTNNMQRAIDMAQMLSEIKLDGLLVVTPPYSKPPQSGMIEFFRLVKKATQYPIIAYNVPSRTGISLQPAIVAQLAREGTIVGLKDATGVVEQFLETQRLLDQPISIVSGEDALIAPLMAGGASGTISASANIIPDEIVAITRAALQQDFQAAHNAQIAALPAIRAAFLESNPIPVKAGLWLRGVIKHPTVRVPLMTATPATQAALKESLRL